MPQTQQANSSNKATQAAGALTGQNSRVSNTSAILIVGTALLYDGIKALLIWLVVGIVVNWLIDIFAFLTFFTWFAIKGIPFAGKRAFMFFGGSGLTFMPVISDTIEAVFPMWTGVVIMVIVSIRAEDAKKAITH